MITCENRDQIRVGPDVPGLTGVPATIGPLRCPECGERSAVLWICQWGPVDPDSAVGFRLSCNDCGSIWEPDQFAVNIGMAAGVLVQLAREHDERCAHDITSAQVTAYLALAGWTEHPAGVAGSLWHREACIVRSLECQRPRQVAVPLAETGGNSDAITGAVERIARIEDRPVAALAADIRRAG